MGKRRKSLRMNKIGVVVGSGTGRELVGVFRRTLNKIAEILGKQIDIIECEHEFGTYESLRNASSRQIEKIIYDELETLHSFYKKFYSLGGRTIFRTAINAETLYLFRKTGKAVKMIEIPLAEKTLLIIRDETQGFYVDEHYKIGKERIEFTGSFTKENFRLVTNFALNEANRVLRQPFETWVVYKHHLFANLIQKWVTDVLPNIQVYQPNHATELLFQDYFTSQKSNDLLMIVGNEVGDILHEVLIFHLEIGSRHTLYSKNIYLGDEFKGLTEYQTVHGSADNIAKKNIVNPTATLRALGNIVENILGIDNFSSSMDRAIEYAYKKLSPCNGIPKTNMVVDLILLYLTKNEGR